MKLRDIYNTAPEIGWGAKSLPVSDREPERPTCVEPAAKGEPLVVPATPELGEVERIVDVWKDVFGLALKPENVKKHLDTIRRWQAKFQNRDGDLL